MSVRTRDWLKFGALVAMAFVFGLAFASALNLPKRGDAAERSPVVLQSGPLRQIPAAKPAADLGDAFAAVAEHVKPAVVFIRSERRERVSSRRLPPGFEDFFQIPRRPQIEQGTGSGTSSRGPAGSPSACWTTASSPPAPSAPTPRPTSRSSRSRPRASPASRSATPTRPASASGCWRSAIPSERRSRSP